MGKYERKAAEIPRDIVIMIEPGPKIDENPATNISI